MRTAYLMIIFLVLCLFSACEKEEEAPFPVSQEQLVEIMADVHFAEAAVKDLLNLEKDSVLRVYYDHIYEIHEIDSLTLDSCLVVLSNYPKTSVKVYQQVVERLATLQNESKKATEPFKEEDKED